MAATRDYVSTSPNAAQTVGRSSHDRAVDNIDRQRRSIRGLRGQVLHGCFGQGERKHAVLEAVIVEDVTETLRDDTAQARCHQSPDGALARGAAAEICARDQDRRGTECGTIENEAGVPGTVFPISQGLERVASELVASDTRQPLEEISPSVPRPQ